MRISSRKKQPGKTFRHLFWGLKFPPGHTHVACNTWWDADILYYLVGGFKHFFSIIYGIILHWLIFFKMVKTTNQLHIPRQQPLRLNLDLALASQLTFLQCHLIVEQPKLEHRLHHRETRRSDATPLWLQVLCSNPAAVINRRLIWWMSCRCFQMSLWASYAVVFVVFRTPRWNMHQEISSIIFGGS